MPRKNRGRVPAGVYHVWRRATGPTLMFRDDFDRTSFCNGLAAAHAKSTWTCVAFVLMPTHFHLILDLADDVLQNGMHDLFGPYAQSFNWRWARSGHLRAESYKLRLIEDDRDLLGVVRYIARNPVRDGLCDRPQDWYWGSYQGSAGYWKPFPFVDDTLVLGAIGGDVARARELLRDIVEPL
jgi:putative transposase